MNSTALHIVLPDAQATMALGGAIARTFPARCVIWLRGDLGAGKTTLARGAIQYLDPRARVKSPTYALIETYELEARTLHHLDLYRVRDPSELEPLGLREFADHVMLIEWPERGGTATPAADLEVSLHYGEADDRSVEIAARSVRGQPILEQLRGFLEITDYK